MFSFLWVSVATCLFFISLRGTLCQEECGGEQYGVEKGLIRLPDFSASIDLINCTWILTAPPGFKLVVKVDAVEFAPSHWRTSSLQLTVDNDVYDIGRNCVSCLSSLVAGEVLKVTFVSSTIPSTTTTSTIYSIVTDSSGYIATTSASTSESTAGSFQIRYRAFDPHRCSRPKSPNNGYAYGKDWRVGQEVSYHCNPPFDLFGSTKTECHIPKGKVIPEWSNHPPRCNISDCKKNSIKRIAGKGAIASPGYPEYKLPPNRNCEWDIVAEPGHQIKIAFTFLKLPASEDRLSWENLPHLYLFDGDKHTPLANLSGIQASDVLNFTTVSNRLIVVLLTGKILLKQEAGLYLEYDASPGACPDPGNPDNGDVVAYNLMVGSSIAYRCKPGYVLSGKPQAECLSTGTWSSPKPSCEPNTVVNQDISAVNVHVEDVDHITDILHSTSLPHDSFSSVTPSTSLSSSVSPASSAPVKPYVNQKSKNKQVPPFKVATKATTHKPTLAHFDSDSQPALDSSEVDSRINTSRKKFGKEDYAQSKQNQHDQSTEEKSHSEKAPQKPVARVDIQSPFRSSDYASSGSGDFGDLPPVQAAAVPTGSSSGSLDSNGGHQSGLTITMVAVIAAVCAPLAIALVLLVVIVLYRRRYPVRMRFGRKFSTFENPMYVKKDAQDPRELTRLSSTPTAEKF